ncbi:MAG: hypothetical protein DMF63_18495 [Acidobacteria bacterium]|nr:MAG: hypothetical protein DMF63_18495 [Acidobacteriota bacterium]
METQFSYKIPIPRRSRSQSFLVPIVIVFGIVLAAFASFIWIENDLGSLTPSFYLLPWTFLTGVCVLAPSVYLLYIGKFDLFHPLVFAAWTYVFPAFVVGALLITFGFVNPYFMSFIDDPEYNLPLTLVYIAVGFLGLTAGFYIPVGQFITNLIEPRLPHWNWKPEQVWLPGIMLLFAGVAFNALGFVEGILGYQRNVGFSVFDGLLFFLLFVLGEGTVLLWLAVFSTKQRGFAFYLMVALLLVFLPIRMAVLGSRSSLVIGLMPIAFAFVASGRKLKLHVAGVFGVIGLLAIVIGATYGTTFRNIKGSESRISAGDYFGQVVATLDYLSTEDLGVVVEQTTDALAARVENLSSVAVVVANYEALAPYEASYGLENNILNDLYTSFIPRFVWNDKPPTSDARAYSDLYFNYGENSFAISPFGDLLRNFGPIGVPLGMLVLGIYLRILYSTLIDTPTPAMWKKVSYFSLITIVSYEAFYATIFPGAVRIVFILGVSLWMVNLVASRTKVSERAT